MAVALGQLSWADIMCHMSIVFRMAEEERAMQGRQAVAVVYDHMVRHSWAQRALQGDPGLQLSKEVAKIDDQVMQAARTRLELLVRQGVVQEKELATTSRAVSEAAAESALAKSSSAAEAVRKRAEAAARALARQQDEMEKKQRAMNSSHSGKDKGGKGHGSFNSGAQSGGWSNKDKKRSAWVEKQIGRKKGKW